MSNCVHDGCTSAKAKPLTPNAVTILKLKIMFLYIQKAVCSVFQC